LTGVGADEEGDGLGVGFWGLGVLSVLAVLPEPPVLPEPLFPEPPLLPVEPPPSGGFGFLRPPVFGVVLELAGLSFGREVRNAPRTSSSSWTSGAAVPITRAQTQTSPNTITLNRITESPYRCLELTMANCAEYGY
jgi:hypothetical protein